MTQLTLLQSHWYFGKENRKSSVCVVYVCLYVCFVCRQRDNSRGKNLSMGFGIS